MESVKASGLKWRKLASGLSPVWVADEADVKNGYTPKTVNLKHLADTPDILVAKCQALQADMLLWRVGHRRDMLKFDGTVRSLLDMYETHPKSPYHALSPGSLRPYRHYLKQLRGHIGAIRLNDISGVDIINWHDLWSENGKHLAAAAMARAVMEAAISFGILLRSEGCVDLATIFRETRKRLPNPKARTSVLSAEQVIAARAAAHADGRPSSALAYALAFETTLRLWDVVGQWVPLDHPDMSSVIDTDRGEKWIGVRWENVDEHLRVSYTPTKTTKRTGVAVNYPLTMAPMVMEELQHWPAGKRKGPMVISEKTDLPYREQPFRERWYKDRDAAGIPSSIWARDLRASGISEGRASDVSIDDAAKVAGHTRKETTNRYDRAVVEAADRFAAARVAGRERSGNSSGNGR